MSSRKNIYVVEIFPKKILLHLYSQFFPWENLLYAFSHRLFPPSLWSFPEIRSQKKKHYTVEFAPLHNWNRNSSILFEKYRRAREAKTHVYMSVNLLCIFLFIGVRIFPKGMFEYMYVLLRISVNMQMFVQAFVCVYVPLAASLQA